MDITQLRYFLTAAETLNYTRAAEKLYISRQALRQALAAMEKEIGMPLFLNRKNKLTLTLAGEYLQENGKGILSSFDRMTQGLERLARRESGLRVGVSGSLVTFLYPEVADTLKKFQQVYPEIPLQWELQNNDEVILGVEQGGLDCGLAIQIPFDEAKRTMEGQIMEKLADYDVIISYGNHHPLSGRERMDLEELQPYHCMGPGALSCSLRPIYEACLEKQVVLDYEIVPSTFDVFYRIEHEDCVVFDFLMAQAPEYARTNHSRLENYCWEMGWLHAGKEEKQTEIGLFCQFMRNEYAENRKKTRIYR